MQPFSKTLTTKDGNFEVTLLFDVDFLVDANHGGKATITANLETGNPVPWANLGLEPPVMAPEQTVVLVNNHDADEMIQRFIAETEAKARKLLSGLETKACIGKAFEEDLTRCFEAKGYSNKLI